jgi:transcriptional regulator with XRE-family HTH domain
VSHIEDRKLELVNQLRDLRSAAGLSGAALATRTGWAQSKVSRIENAKQAVTDSDITAWCRALATSESVTAALLSMLRDIRLEESRWQRRLHAGNEPIIEQSIDVERHASVIRVFELAVVPGLVQTADYARHVFQSVSELHGSPRDTEQAVRARIRRQQVLYDATKRIEILTTEWALRTSVCPRPVMAAQIDRLLAVLGLGSLRFGIIPLGAQLPTVPMNGFWIVDDHVVAETVNAEITVHDPDDVALHERLIDMLWSVAADGNEARTLLSQIASDLAPLTDH